MTEEEMKRTLADFRRAYPSIASMPAVHSVHIVLVPDLRIEVWVEDSESLEGVIRASKLPHIFNAEVGGRDIAIPVVASAQRRARALGMASTNIVSRSRFSSPEITAAGVRGGDPAAASGANYFGTAGWSIRLNGVPVCISNWHILCSAGNDSTIGSRVDLAGQNVASLYAFEPIHFGGKLNTWDYALARYDSSDDANAEMRTCEDGSRRPYPVRLSSAIFPGQSYWKVGNGVSGVCGAGVLMGLGTTRIDYDQGSAWFENVLIFSHMADHGDSGSVIVREADNTVTALLFAVQEGGGVTYGCPLYKAGWRRLEPKDGEAGLPEFIEEGLVAEARGLPPSRLRDSSVQSLALDTSQHHLWQVIGSGTAARLESLTALSPDLPNLGGRTFLGSGQALMSTGRKPYDGLPSGLNELQMIRWANGTVVPPSPDGRPVTAVLTGAFYTGRVDSVTTWMGTFLFFG